MTAMHCQCKECLDTLVGNTLAQPLNPIMRPPISDGKLSRLLVAVRKRACCLNLLLHHHLCTALMGLQKTRDRHATAADWS